MKLKIVSDGTSKGTHVLTEDGKEIEMVKDISWTCSAPGIATISLRLLKVPVEIEGHLETVEHMELRPSPPPEPEETNPAEGIGIVL